MEKLITITMLVLLAVSLILPSGCKNKETEDTGISVPESNRWLELLRVLPANENTLKAAYLQDIAYLAEKTEQYPQTVVEYTLTRNLPSLFGQSPRAYSDAEWKETLGFVQGDVDQTVHACYFLPVDYYEAVRGRFRREDIDNAVKTGPLNEILEVVSYTGHEFYSWGTDRDISFSRRSNVRPLGRGMRLALVDDFIFWVGLTDSMKEMIDSYEDNIESLADIEDYRLLAGALEELDTMTAFFSSEPQSISHIKEVYREFIEQSDPSDASQRFAEEVKAPVLLKPFRAFATGAGIDEKGYYMVIVLLNSNEKVAQANATLLKKRINQAEVVWRGQKWSDFIESVDIDSRGRLTLASLYGQVCVYWSSFEIQGGLPYEPLLMHE